MVKIGLKRAPAAPASTTPPPPQQLNQQHLQQAPPVPGNAAHGIAAAVPAVPQQAYQPGVSHSFSEPITHEYVKRLPHHHDIVSDDSMTETSTSSDDEATDIASVIPDVTAAATSAVSARLAMHSIPPPPESELWKEMRDTVPLPEVLSAGTAAQLPWDMVAPAAPRATGPPTLPLAHPHGHPASDPTLPPGPLPVVPPADSRAAQLERASEDLATRPDIAFGSCFRAVFSKSDGSLVLPGFAGAGSAQPKRGVPPSALHSVQVSPDAANTQPLSVLALQSAQQEGSGRITFNLSPTLHGQLSSAVVKELAAAFTPPGPAGGKGMESLGAAHAANVLRLVDALWGNDSLDDDWEKAAPKAWSDDSAAMTEGYAEARRRRRLLRWLRSASGSEAALGGDISGDMAQLSLNGKAVEAAKASRKLRNPGAAALLLAARGNARIQELLQRSEGLAGPVSEILCDSSEASVSRRWKQALVRHLELHGATTAERPLKSVVVDFLSSTERPPWYHEALRGDASPGPAAAAGAEKEDLCAHLLRIWCGGCGAEDPTSALCDPMTWKHTWTDYSLNWLVCLLLGSVDVVELAVPAERLELLTIAYAEQLVAKGHWRWGVFVLLTLADDGLRKRHVTRVVARHTAEITPASPGLALPLPSLSVPHEWAAEAQAQVTLIAPQPKPQVPTRPPLSNIFDLDDKAFLL